MNARTATFDRTTNETSVQVALTLDGSGQAAIATGLPFLDHMLVALTRHARIDLTLRCQGDLAIDDHHSAEDTALACGTAFDRALGERHGIARFGHACVPMDETLVQVAIDLSGRPFAAIDLPLQRPMLGTLASENVRHWLRSFATAARLTLHVQRLAGDNDHHITEAAFKALALALRVACARDGSPGTVPSTKGTLQ